MKKIYLIFSLVLLGSVGAFAQGDDCATAVTVTNGLYTADGPSAGGGNVTICNTLGTNADWYKFTPVCDGNVTISNDFPANTFRTRLSVMSGTCASLICESAISNTTKSTMNLALTGGTEYFIEWDDRWDALAFDWSFDFQVSGGVTTSVSPGITQAFLAWIAAGGEGGWDIQWGQSGFNLGTGTQFNVDSSAGVSATISGLQPETTYDYYIALEGTGCYVGPITFTTLPLCPVPNGITINPLATSAVLSWGSGGGTVAGQQPSYTLQYGPVGTPIDDPAMIHNGTSSAPAHNAQNLTSCTDYDMYVREICDPTATPMLMSLWEGPITVSTDCVCPEPSGLTATALPDPFDYELSWTAGGSETQWNVQWGPAGFIFGSGTTVQAGSNPFTVSGVTPDANLEYYVQADCGSGDLSTWVGPFSFITNVFCPDPTGLGANNITTISANIFWNVSGTTTDYTIEWGESGFTQGTGTTSSLQSTTALLTGLTPDTEYCYYVQSNCGPSSDEGSNFVGAYCFSTLAACPVPTNLDILNLSTNSVTLNWQPGASETEWDVEWGFPGFTPGAGEEEGAGTSTTTSDIYATGLNASAPYCFYVRAVCGGLDGNSLWEGPYCFSTLLSNDLACGAIELLTNGDVSLHTNEGATVNGEDQITPNYTTAINDQLAQEVWFYNQWANPSNINVEAPVWFKFKAPTSGKVEVSTFNDVTDGAGTITDLALYEVGNCNVMSNFSLIAANTYANRFGFNGNPSTSLNAPRGSKILACDLNPGQYYYILLDNYSGPSAGMDPGIFGISVTDIPEPNTGTATDLTICNDGDAVDLFDAITGYSVTTGSWYNNGNSLSGSTVSFPATAGTFAFDYIINNACGSDTTGTTITTVQGPNAGMDGYFSTCNTEDVVLLNHLQGFADLGGTWSDVNGQFNVANGIFNAYGLQYGTYSFYYIVAGNGVCSPDTAKVNIILNDNCLGVSESATSTLEMFPNPVNDILTIANLSIEGNATVVVYDAQGKMVVSHDISNHSGNFTIDMTQLETGLYVVEVNAETTTEKVRVIKY